MKYALVNFRVILLGTRPFVIYTDHASLRTATNSPHLSQRMARWLSFFAEYNFRVEYKPGKLNVLADALSRRPDYELAHSGHDRSVRSDTLIVSKGPYQGDGNYTPLVRFLSYGKDAKAERVNRVLENTLRSIGAEAPRSWSDQLPTVEFAFNNAVHASTGFTPFYLNELRHPQVPLTFRGGTDASIVGGGEARKAFSSQVSEIEPESLRRQLPSFIDDRLTLISRVRDAMTLAQDKQKEYSDKQRGNLIVFKEGSNKLKHRFIGPFAVLARHGTAYTIDLPKSMATRPTFYVGRLKRYHDLLGPPSHGGRPR
ncbi:LOW QUALITY PROTEIN: Pol protein [Phytophthora palmivora]|uniref:Pol protein n=1 Tax=Phytophthora palmivora TaxID=4796 RepID=A0A2P4YDT3_9STRA|nr:LOW QUALITY PROTEIN: Pol protein [Phytophthora palmivora]